LEKSEKLASCLAAFLAIINGWLAAIMSGRFKIRIDGRFRLIIDGRFYQIGDRITYRSIGSLTLLVNLLSRCNS
jgi:hypothetical protein